MDIFNWWALLAATVLAFALGGLWYGPVFGSAWLAALGKNAEDIEPSPTPFVVSFFAALVTAVTLAWLMHALQFVTWQSGALLGGWQ
jgi:hypothetical protein